MFVLLYAVIMTGIYDDDQEIITLSRSDFGKHLSTYLIIDQLYLHINKGNLLITNFMYALFKVVIQ